MVKGQYKKNDVNSLIRLSQQGNINALEELIRREQKNIFTMFSYLTTKRHDIADLTQDTLLKMAKNIPAKSYVTVLCDSKIQCRCPPDICI